MRAISARSLGSDVRRWRRDTLDDDLSALEREHRDAPFAAVVSWREPYVLLAGRVAERLGLPSALPDASLARDKLRMKSTLRAAGVRVADSIAVNDDADLRAAPSRLFPGVLKPRHAFASICAVRVDDVRAARRELREKRDKLVTTHLERVDLAMPCAPEFVLESFVGGTEHTVESFVSEGDVVLQIVSDKLSMTPPHFVETGDVMPSALDEVARAKLSDAARRAIRALGIRNGWTHVEVKLWRDEAWVMEIAARMGGGYTRELVQAAYGLDMVAALLDHVASGVLPALPPARGVVRARRLVVTGLSVVLDAAAVDRLAAQGRLTLVARESTDRRRGLFLGAPYSYEGTIASYLVRAEDHAALARDAVEIDALVTPASLQLPLPRAAYRAYLAAKRLVDASKAG